MSMQTTERPWQRWYHLERWERRSKLQLKQFPLCKMCLDRGIVTPANVADHIIPHRGDQQLFWFGELQSLCHHHHSSDKALLERGIVKDFEKDIGIDGWPTDPKHPANAGSTNTGPGGVGN